MKKNNKKKNKYEKIILVVTLVLFIVLSLFIGANHEPWADEAQAWLLARDTSIYSLLFKYLHADGHPALWHIVLKAFQFFKFKYEWFYIIPVIFSSIGVYLFLFKSKFKIYLKVLIPFTYFIFYQYTIVSRGYCLVFLLFSLLAVYWSKRKEKPILFSLILFLLINSESYTFILAGSIYLYLLVEFILDKDFKNKKRIISYILIFIYFITTILYVFPSKTNSFFTSAHTYRFSYSFLTTSFMNNYFTFAMSLLLLAYIGYALYKNKDKKKTLCFLLLIIPNYMFCRLFYANMWHYGIMFLIFILYVWLFEMENNKLFNILLLVCSVVQVFYSINSSIYDIKNTYSPAEDVSKFIKQYNYNNLKVYGLSFNEVAINPYFEKNINDNWDKDNGFFYWNFNSDYYKHDYNFNNLINEDLDIIIFSKFYYDYSDIFNEKYDVYEFYGNSYYAYKPFETQDTFVLVKKDLYNSGR